MSYEENGSQNITCLTDVYFTIHISIYCPVYNEVEVNVTVHEKCVYDDTLLLKH